ncbi:type I-U CRISPR-associated RAMP protein Csb1/Cas7u [Streptomyces sp. HNM0574]|uniref:type I-G CRISPR-associated RAMP protein Csb1/Cas7g n=1 Tax=Streptomyces sp. HNM0574 TaxID=2714954 RepID=UPI00146BE27D|nr:type I-U CRISPR-associated RAMP protein Csb1/Cas7u [Streptomyces sp. HNM0574]NLU70860.1 type I-U CRISPR-associated protein Cas7 [Streptomyces sp. HNM0574]
MANASLSARLWDAVGEERQHTALVVQAVYQGAGGTGATVMPPTYPIGDNDPIHKKYLLHDRLVPGEGRVPVVTLDQEQAQANRVEEALLRARDKGRLRYPLFEMRSETPYGEVRLTSLDFPHRYADAYLRDSTVDGVRFDKSEVGQLLRQTSAGDVRPLFTRDPGSLVFGAWDSHRKGRWPKFARLYAAYMHGVDPVLGVRRGGRLDPQNLTGRVDDKKKAEGDWGHLPPSSEAKKAPGEKLSEIGHGNIAPNPVPGGVTVREVRRMASVSLAGLERLEFGDVSEDAATAARATLAALALAGDRLAFGKPSVWLRSGCDLAKQSETVGLERPGGGVDELDVSVQQALDAFHELRDKADGFGVVMGEDTIVVEPISGLANALSYAVSQAADDGDE